MPEDFTRTLLQSNSILEQGMLSGHLKGPT